jgi:hypothetical protein
MLIRKNKTCFSIFLIVGICFNFLCEPKLSYKIHTFNETFPRIKTEVNLENVYLSDSLTDTLSNILNRKTTQRNLLKIVKKINTSRNGFLYFVNSNAKPKLYSKAINHLFLKNSDSVDLKILLDNVVFFISQIHDTNNTDYQNFYNDVKNRVNIDFQNSLSKSHSITSLKKLWNLKNYNILERNFFISDALLTQRIFSHYFERLQDSTSEENQQIIENELNDFPGLFISKYEYPINDAIIYLLVKYNNKNGQLYLYKNKSYFKFLSFPELALEYELLNTETGLDNITREELNFRNNQLYKLQQIFQNDKLYYQLIYNEEGRLDTIVQFSCNEKIRETFFLKFKETIVSYFYNYKNGINVTEKNVLDKLHLVKQLKNSCRFEESIATLQKLQDNIQDYDPLKERVKDSINAYKIYFFEFEISRINHTIIIIDSLRALKKFDQARTKLDEIAINGLPKNAPQNLQINQLKHAMQLEESQYIQNQNIQEFEELSEEINRKISFDEYSNAIVLCDKIIDNPKFSTLTKYEDIKKLRESILDKSIELNLSFVKYGEIEISTNYLNESHFTNGDKLHLAKTIEDFWDKTYHQIPVYCFYNFDSTQKKKGFYYNFYALNDLNGRKLYGPKYRLPFLSELYYLNELTKVQKFNNGPNKNYYKTLNQILFSNTSNSWNGFNQVSYFGPLEWKKSYEESLRGEYGDYYRDSKQNKYMFWALKDIADFENFYIFNDLFLTDFFNLGNKSNPVDYVIFTVHNNDINFIESPDLDEINGKINYRTLVTDKTHWNACQIKLVKNRPILNPSNLIKISSLELKNEYSNYPVKTKEIKIAKNHSDWKKFCDQEIPAALSYEFKEENDAKYGKIYNCFALNYPTNNSIERIHWFEFSNLKYNMKDYGDEFFKKFETNYNLTDGVKLIINDKTEQIEWQRGGELQTNSFGNSKSCGSILITNPLEPFSENLYLLDVNYSQNNYNNIRYQFDLQRPEGKYVNEKFSGRTLRGYSTKKSVNTIQEIKTIKATFKDYQFGDISHWIFVDNKGKEYNFLINEASDKYKLEIWDEVRQKDIPNKKYIGRIFEIECGKEKIDIGVQMPHILDADVIKNLSLE